MRMMMEDEVEEEDLQFYAFFLFGIECVFD